MYTVQGMDCADCARHVEDGVAKLDHVLSARVDFATALLHVEGRVDEEAIRRRVEALGYRLGEAAAPEAKKDSQRSGMVEGFLHFVFSQTETRLALVGGVLILISFGLGWVGINGPFSPLLQLGGMVLAGYPIARSAFANLWINRTVNINLLMTIAAVGAALIGELGEAASLIFLYNIAEALEGYTTDRARRSLGELRSLAPARAIRLEVAGEESVPVEALHPGERVLVRPGERVPIDGVVLHGSSQANQAPITGESQPVEKNPGDPLFAGTLNGSGALEIEVSRAAADTTLARIVRMVTEAQSKRAPAQRFIDRFATVYTPAVVAAAVLVAVIPPLLFGQPFLDPPGGEHGWLYRGLALLVIACPCALVISAPVTVLSAIASAARQGVLFKGGVYLDTLANVRRIAFDKTGTLTMGKPALTRRQALDCACEEDAAPTDACDECVEVLAIAGALEQRSLHPLAGAVVDAARQHGVLERYPPAESVELVAGGLRGTINGRIATIGSHPHFDRHHPHAAELCARIEQAEANGETTMLVCDGDRVRGFLAAADEIRPESRGVVEGLKALGLHPVMLTGDNAETARRVGVRLGIDDIRAGLLPEEKAGAVGELARGGSGLAMVGDGINDAPALAQAALGIAVAGPGNAAAMETADVVLMGGGLERLPFAVRIARLAQTLIRQNIVFSIATKLIFILLALSGLATMWMAVLADMGVSLLVTFNALRPFGMKES
jgi:Cd2+/Zn2+-exporting ATPase